MAKMSDTISNYLDLRRKIQSKQYSPVYLLHGEEVYFIDAITDLIEQSILPESERSFNQTLIYGKEVKVHDLISMARRYPMMSQYQVIIVKDAQDIKEFDKLLSYLDNPMPSTVLVCAFRGSKMDMRTKVGKQADRFGGAYHAAKLRDYQIKDWLPEYFKQQGCWVLICP
jgi:DNA polymerase-3 subunit delta